MVALLKCDLFNPQSAESLGSIKGNTSLVMFVAILEGNEINFNKI